MSVRGPRAISASLLALAAGSPAAAQNFYVGAGVETSVESDLSALGTDFSNDLTMGSVLGGVRFNHSNFFFGAEGETSLFTDYDSDWSPASELDRVSRLRAIGGYDFGAFSAFGAVGGVWTEGELAGPGLADSADGTTWGVGGEYSINDRWDVRLEYINDEVEFDSGYEWQNSSVRAAAIVKF